MLNKKVCMVGSFAVGKTALVQQYVHSIFSDKYLSSVGVKISKKEITVGNEDVNLILWDLEGQDDYSNLNPSYLRGAMGIFLVADGTRAETLSAALALRKQVALTVGDKAPVILLLNKSDIKDHWEVKQHTLDSLKREGMTIIETSAKDGDNVHEAFCALTEAMLKKQK